MSGGMHADAALPRPAFRIDDTVRFGGRTGQVATYQATATGYAYGVVLETGAWLPNVPEAALLEESAQ